jgi:GNAT superfamily N-acetyltransferase
VDAPLYKLRRAVRLHGVGGAAALALARAVNCVAANETHLWFALVPAGDRPHPRLPEGLTLRRGSEAEVELLRDLETVSPEAARARLREGHDLWLVVDDDQAVFTTWIFRRRAPAVAARGGWFDLPGGTVCQEDSFTAVHARGRGIAPAAWAAIADVLAAEGPELLIRKAESGNVAARRAGEKVGFRPVAVMNFRRVGPIWRTSVRALDSAVGPLLVERLDSTEARRAAVHAPAPGVS